MNKNVWIFANFKTLFSLHNTCGLCPVFYILQLCCQIWGCDSFCFDGKVVWKVSWQGVGLDSNGSSLQNHKKPQHSRLPARRIELRAEIEKKGFGKSKWALVKCFCKALGKLRLTDLQTELETSKLNFANATLALIFYHGNFTLE